MLKQQYANWEDITKFISFNRALTKNELRGLNLFK